MAERLQDNHDPEVWCAVDGYEGLYEVSSHGGLRRMKPLRRLNPFIANNGYRHVSLCKNSVVWQGTLHRLIAAAFFGPCPEGMQVNHIDGDKLNNHISNLEYVTGSENMRHAIDTGLFTPVTPPAPPRKPKPTKAELRAKERAKLKRRADAKRKAEKAKAERERAAKARRRKSDAQRIPAELRTGDGAARLAYLRQCQEKN